jgi:hypothetical protein
MEALDRLIWIRLPSWNVLYTISGVHVAGHVGNGARTSWKVHHKGHSKWVLEVENFVTGSPLHVFLKLVKTRSGLEVVTIVLGQA